MAMFESEAPLHLRIGAGPTLPVRAASRLLPATRALLVRSRDRVSLLASATAWRLPARGRREARLALSTAAHVFEGGARLGDLGIAEPGSGRVHWLHADAGTLRRDPEADVAWIELAAPAGGVAPAASRTALPAGLLCIDPPDEDAGRDEDDEEDDEDADEEDEDDDGAPRRRPSDDEDEDDDAAAAATRRGRPPAPAGAPRAWLLVGWPAERARWHAGRLVAQPVACTTERSPGEAGTWAYRRIGTRRDGRPVETPALDGVSGALLWSARRVGRRRHLLAPAGLQVAFAHGRHLRCTPLHPLRRWIPAG